MIEAAAPTPDGQPAPPLSSPRDGGDAVVALPAGTRVAEFEIRRVLGSGGFGIVYLAWDHALEREVALKEYMPGTLADRGEGLTVSVRSQPMADTFALGLRSFINEARMLARFDHPSLVKVYRFWEDNGTAYMVMPCYQGRTLRQVRAGMVMPPGEAACRRVLDALLSALEVLHKEGVYHRDIAPDNILLGDDGLPVLLDFGAARRVIGEGNKALTSIMKPHFAPLEQYADQSSMRQGPWTDLYALGGTIFFFITGLEPVPAASRALHDDQPRLTELRPPECSLGFLAAIDWMLALKPPERPQSVHMLRDVLEGRITMPGRQASDRTMPGVALRDASVDILTGPGDLPAADAVSARDGSERTVVMPSAPAPLMPMPAVASAAPAPAAAALSTRRHSLAVLALLIVLNVLAWWWFTRPARPADSAPALSARAVPAPASAAGSAAAPAPGPEVAPNETILSVLPARAPRAPAAATVDTTPPRSSEPPAVVPRTVADAAPPRPGDAASAAARPRAGASAPVALATDVPPGPRARCADRNFLSQLICMKRECETAALQNHPECVRMREQEAAQQQPQR